MKITLAIQKNVDGGGLYLVASFDEYTRDEWNGIPDFYTKDLESTEGNGPIREVNIELDESTLEELFAPAVIEANWVDEQPVLDDTVVRMHGLFRDGLGHHGHEIVVGHESHSQIPICKICNRDLTDLEIGVLNIIGIMGLPSDPETGSRL